MKKLIVFLFTIILFSCEKGYYPYTSECKECKTIITENGVVISTTTIFVCGEELIKQENANFIEVNNHTKIITITKTTCIKGNIKTK